MESSLEAVPRPARHYRLPALLHDIHLLDLLEICGTTLEAGRVGCVSQSTVSRRTRALADDFALKVNRRWQMGCCYGTSPAMRLLRLGCRAHRLAAGVARLGTDVLLQPLLADLAWLLPSPPRFRLLAGWLELVRQGVLDGALVSGLEFPGEQPPAADHLELLPLGERPFELATMQGPVRSAETVPTVLVPNRAVAKGLQRELQRRGLAIQTAGSSCQTPAQWLERLQRANLAMPLPRLEPDHWWRDLLWQPMPLSLQVPLWLVLPAGWRQQGVLVHTAEQLGYRQAVKQAPQ